MKGKEVDAVARKIIADAGYGDYFGHGLGHSVGIDIHENPRFSVAEERTIEKGWWRSKTGRSPASPQINKKLIGI